MGEKNTSLWGVLVILLIFLFLFVSFAAVVNCPYRRGSCMHYYACEGNDKITILKYLEIISSGETEGICAVTRGWRYR